MTTAAGSSAVDTGNDADRWDAFIRWARRFHEAANFDADERAYKLTISERLAATQQALRAGADDWIDRLERAFGPPNNLTNWRFHRPFITWCREDPARAAAAFQLLWNPSRVVSDRFDDFIAAVSAPSPRVPITEASFLHMTMDPLAYPIFRATPTADAMRLSGYVNTHPSGQTAAGSRYVHYLDFLDRILAESARRGLELRDRLDAQSLLWTITRWHPGDDWSEDERSAFAAFRGDRVPNGEADEAPVSGAAPSAIPDVPRERLLATMDEFDQEERGTDPWQGWENDPRHKWAIVENGRRYPVKHIIAKAAGISTKSFGGDDQANTYVQKCGLRVESLRSPSAPAVWWVNQGSTYVQERDGGYLWAPHVSKAGTTFAHWADLKRLRVDDVVLHYANSALRAVSIVEAPSKDAAQPSDLPESQWGDTGHLVTTRYSEFLTPILLSDIPATWREAGPGPFTKQGSVKQGYLFPTPSELLPRLIARFPDRWPEAIKERVLPLADGAGDYEPPSFGVIRARIDEHGMRLTEQTLRRYHLSLSTRKFVILAGISGTGKTWLAQAYAESIGARHLVVPVAPNWTTNEDLLGFFNPLSSEYHDTPFSWFLREAASAYATATDRGQTPQPYHLILDEMNLARVEYYFASFLSAMEVRARPGVVMLNLGPHDAVTLPPNLFVVGTVNIDETTHGFADKVYDRAQLVELSLEREDIAAHLNGSPYQSVLLTIWDAVSTVGPFAFRVLDDIAAYVQAAEALGAPWEQALDEQLAQKVLPKLNGAKPGIGPALEQIVLTTSERFPLTHARARKMLEGFHLYGFVSYFT
jgi:hypothetical protein